jgi:hypothetical protein
VLTEQDKSDAEAGITRHERLQALRHALIADAQDARALSRAEGLDERFAASLRGKAKAYEHAAGMVNKIMRGEGIRPPVWSSARKKAAAFWDRKIARRATI